MKHINELAHEFSEGFVELGDLSSYFDAQIAKISFIAGIKVLQKTLCDELNHYKSKLAESTRKKLDRRDYKTGEVIKLEAKIELLQQLKKKLL